ncbi:MAG: leucine--tRNA ligase [Fastidiosipila sp.]|nr:leucine--tRNA ligase [Fastidiosipila sp.]
MSYSKEIDRKWQKIWDKENLAVFDEDLIADKLYVLEMFSYPSGAKLHVGHWYNYSLSDSYARMKKMQGYEIFQPMGFDAFGLPAENYAIATGIHPQDSTRDSIISMKEQLKEIGGLFNWDAELATCDPDYYRWNQWLFLQLYKNNLAYRKKAPVNWCPSCYTVLANEQVESDGTCERCHSEVVRRNLTQWFFRITDYAEQLLDGLEDLDWPDKTKKIQTNWIGRSEGATISFGVEKDGEKVYLDNGEELTLNVFTTRADTLYGVSYLVIAPEHDLLDSLITAEYRTAVEAYQEKATHLSEIERQSVTREKSGVFTGSYAVHPLTGKKVPLWTSDYVIAQYGTGVVMAVPAHDERDFEFASSFNLPIPTVIHPEEKDEQWQVTDTPFCEDGILVNSGSHSGLTSAAGRKAIVRDLSASNKGEATIQYRLRDWLVSRQRYWGTPIPIVYCDKCGTVPVPEDQLPVELPYNVEFKPDGQSPLAKSEDFINTTCPTCGGPARRDPDTLDTFVCSSWYMFRFVDNKNEQAPFDSDKVNQMCPVDVYIGGAEHAAMHLLYARFITKVLRDLGYLNFDEPFSRLVHQGLILGADGNKMSKSLGNTISPDPYIEAHGSDVFRLYLAFGFSYTEGGPWSDDGLRAMIRFVQRVESFAESELANEAKRADLNRTPRLPQTLTADDKELDRVRHNSIKEVTKDAERFQFNTSVARIMELLNALQKYVKSPQAKPELTLHVFIDFIKLLAPFAPHFAEELWQQLGHEQSVFLSDWPQHDESALELDMVEIAIQINGRIKERINVPGDATEEEIKEIVSNQQNFKSWLDGKTIRKWIVVPQRLVNIVVG